MSKRLMPTYLVNFLKEIYDGTIPSNFGERMVSRQFIASVKELYETLGGDNPSDYSRRMVNEYLIKFFNEIEIVEYTDDDVLMNKTISSDLVYPACRVDSIGGMSYKSENLIVLNDVAETTTNDITYKVENGVITLNGTASANFSLSINLGLSISGDYVLAIFNNTTLNVGNVRLYHSNSGGNVIVASATTFDTTNNYKAFTSSAYSGVGIGISIPNETTLTNLIIKPMLVSGSTAPTEYKQGFEGIRDSKVTAVKTYNTDNELLDTYTVPSAITSLEGYGQGNPNDPTELNVVDFVAGKYYEKGYIDNGVWVSKEDEISITEQAPLLECVDSGSIVFENTYNQDMPNEVTTWIKGN